MPLPAILDGFDSLQKQLFSYFWSQGKKSKISKNISFFGKYRVFFGKYRKIGEKSAIFRRFFYKRFFLLKIVSNPTENRFFAEKSAEKTDFLVLGYKYKFYIRRNSITPTGDLNKYKSSSTYGYSRIGKTSISSVVPTGTLVSVK